MAERTRPLTPHETPQDPKARYWAPGSAIPIRKAVLDQLGMSTTDMSAYTLRAKLEAAYLTELQRLADNTTDGRHAQVVNLLMAFQNIVRGVLNAEVDEANAKAGADKDPFMGRILSR